MSEASQGPRKKRRLSRLSLSYVKTTALSSGRNEDNRSGNGHSITIDPVQEKSVQAVNGTEEDFETEESPTLVTLTQDQIINSDEDCSDNQFWTISDEEAGAFKKLDEPFARDPEPQVELVLLVIARRIFFAQLLVIGVRSPDG